jgi:phage terminase small subunit
VADRPTPPEGLGAAGEDLWHDLHDELPERMEFNARELAILTAACRQLDTIVSLERAIKRDGLMVTGSTGQRRLHPAVTEARQARLTFGRLLGDLHLPDAEERPMTSAQQRAQRAATSRWASRRALRAVHGA